MIENCDIDDCQKRLLLADIERLTDERDQLRAILSKALPYLRRGYSFEIHDEAVRALAERTNK